MRKSDIIAKITISEPRIRKAIRHRLNEAVSEQLDQEYVQAVQSGDMTKAEAMVRKAAADAGFNVEAYHGTGNSFTKFEKRSHTNGNIYGDGFYFAEDPKEAAMWGRHAASSSGKSLLIHVYLSVHRPLELFGETVVNGLDPDTAEDVIARLDPEYDSELIDAIRNGRDVESDYHGYSYSDVGNIIKDLGYDAVQGYYQGSYHIMVFNPEQIKSAEAVTYNDQGNIIPLSQRFSGSDDIRYEE